jgi:Ser/Thr protein kinase RdoA (MazF antagonist)
VSYDDLIRAALRSQWHLVPADAAVLPSGLMSRAWAVDVDGERLLARLVDHTARQPLEAGLAAAAHLHARGVEIGRPVRTLAGSLTAETPVGILGVLRRVPGRRLDGADPVDQQWWGDRLGAAHRGLAGFDHPGLRRWNWLHHDDAHLDVEPWLRPAIADAVTAMIRLTVTDRLTYGVLHGDPAAEGFVVDPGSGRAGLLDWGACGTGPLVYDLAAAVVYAGGLTAAGDLLDGYVAAGPVGREEVEAALPVLVRFRWAVQADWFARRLAAARSDGVAGDPVGLRAARVALESMSGGRPPG